MKTMSAFLKITTILLLLLYALVSDAHSVDCFAVQFIDKENNTFSVKHPEHFLSAKAIQRRKQQNKPITESDLPVSSVYLERLGRFNLEVLYASKWLNTAVVICDQSLADHLQKLPFVKSIRYIGKKSTIQPTLAKKGRLRKRKSKKIDQFYGHAKRQIQMLNGDWLHEKGHQGTEITVAILDAGFLLSDKLSLLQNATHHQNTTQHKDFVDLDNSVFETCDHGTKVLSVMAANSPGLMVGTAPAAQFICLKTEDIRGEFLLDEYNWAVGIEYADSIGAHLAVSGLGYTFFDDQRMSYVHEDLNQNTAISTQIANLAYKKGMIVVVSAGNEGDNEWKYVSFPANAKGTLSVGAVDVEGQALYFSSKEKVLAGMSKPDVIALGKDVTVACVFGKNSTERAMGSSYSAPLVGGLVASLWSAFPEVSNKDIVAAVQYSKGQKGSKLPNFQIAYHYLNNLTTTPSTTLHTKPKLNRKTAF